MNLKNSLLIGTLVQLVSWLLGYVVNGSGALAGLAIGTGAVCGLHTVNYVYFLITRRRK